MSSTKDGILALLAHARDGVFLLREGITEGGCLTLAHNARGFSDRTNTGNTRELGEHLFDALVLEGGFKRVLGIFHACIVPYLGVNVKP